MLKKIIEKLRAILSGARCQHEFSTWEQVTLNTRTRQGEFWQRYCPNCKTRWTVSEKPEGPT